MLEIKGKYTTAKVFAQTVEYEALDQIRLLCSQEFTKDCSVRIMPDVHPGIGCTIGFTANLGDMVIPSVVGVDIGCGMLCVTLGKEEIDFEKFDDVVRKYVPSGGEGHETQIAKFDKIEDICCYNALNRKTRIMQSLGTLGGGNHFIELDKDDDGVVYLVIHTGSRYLGKQVAEYYKQLAFDTLRGWHNEYPRKQAETIKSYKAAHREKELQKALTALKTEYENKLPSCPSDLCYLVGEDKERYLHDMKICQEFASLNRRLIADRILSHYFGFGQSIRNYESFETVHNYIDFNTRIVRKGAVSAAKGETLLIPINMRDGSLICVGKGNEDWNFSAPHGAGRLFSRNVAKNSLTLEEYQEQMQGIYSSCVSEATIDESPMAYKNMDEIVEQIEPTAEIVKIIKPIYNFKA